MQYYINRDEVLRVIKNAIYIEEVYDHKTCDEWTYDTINEEEVIDKINKMPFIKVFDGTRGEEQMELIDKKELLVNIRQKLHEVERGWSYIYVLPEIISLIKEAPEIESRPKGKWIGISYDGYADGNPVYDRWECSNCGLEIDDDNGEILWRYCPDCGADMRGEE